jgi:hypothetical protein
MAMNQANLPCGPGIALPKGPSDARYVENVMEHTFLSELLQHCWFIRRHPVEVIRPEVDEATTSSSKQTKGSGTSN